MPAADGANSLEAALDELYGVDPDEFVETRKRLAGELRAAGDKDAVKAVQAARRPTTAAWALNRLSRDEPGIVEELLERSRDLRSAQTGRGGRDAMREATRAQRRALSDATDAAMALLGERATDAYRSQMLATLHAASADQTVGEQLRVGRLIREASGSTGFPEGPMLTLVPDLEAEPVPKPKPPAKRPPSKQAPPSRNPSPKVAPPTGDTRDAAQQERAEQAKAAEQRRIERDRERERAAIEAAQRRVEEAEAAARAAQEEALTAEAAAVAAREQVAALQHDLDGARREARAVDAHAVQARREATRLEKAAARLRSRS